MGGQHTVGAPQRSKPAAAYDERVTPAPDQLALPAGARCRTTVELLREVSQHYGDHDAFVDGDIRLSYAQWDRAADGLANHLSRIGVGKGDVVVLLLQPSADYAIRYQAVMRLGAITSGINS